ncbi:hypothetical protein ACFE33_12505 [Falsihalocynthiibacter sp. SS001]|uniref:hypothetical protein n=1 Tax=Falsihalocynthiibacter sp. SS001 TaxID=3349698 RepID=UPI0036D37393
MPLIFKLPILGAALIALTACISPENYESAPVQVSTQMGFVTCQLYRRDLVVWDRAIGRPEGMTVEVADNVCRAEGERLRSG